METSKRIIKAQFELQYSKNISAKA